MYTIASRANSERVNLCIPVLLDINACKPCACSESMCTDVGAAAPADPPHSDEGALQPVEDKDNQNNKDDNKKRSDKEADDEEEDEEEEEEEDEGEEKHVEEDEEGEDKAGEGVLPPDSPKAKKKKATRSSPRRVSTGKQDNVRARCGRLVMHKIVRQRTNSLLPTLNRAP